MLSDQQNSSDENLSIQQCKNCLNEVNGDYCSTCGQRKIEFTFKHVVDNLSEGIEFKRGLLYNLKELTFNPGKAIMEYMEGKTRPFLNPVSYSLLIITGLFLTGERFKNAIGAIETPYLVHYLIFTFPMMYGLGSFLAYIKKGYNYTQHFILSLFVTSHFILLIVIPNLYLEVNWMIIASLYLLYTVWVYQLIFREHLVATITNQFTILIQALFFEAIFVALSMAIWFPISLIFE